MSLPDTTTDIAASHWPMNAWYAAAYDVEVGRRLTPVRVAGVPIVLYRRLDGRPAALADACWHRLVPLALGSLEGDDVRCGYHGIRYDPDGRCTHMPAQQTINPSAAVRSYPVAERHRFIWVWPGDPALADPATIPDMHWNDGGAWVADGKVIEVQAGYQLVLDNLMDLTHEEFIHTSSIGNDALSESDFTTTHDSASGRVTVTRWMLGIEAPPLWKYLLSITFPGYQGPVDRWQIIHFTAPATICIDVGVAKAGTGAPDGDRSQGVNGYVLNTMCPTGPKSCRYLWAIARNFATDCQRVTTELREGVAGVFAEDEAMINAQQAAIDANPGYDFYNLNIDAGGRWARRLITAMVERGADVSLNVTRDWQICTVAGTDQIATAVRAVSLCFPQAPPAPVEGGHVDVQVMVAGRPEIRSYSVVRRDPNDPRVLVLGVQAAADSRGGSLAMHGLAPGARIRATQPLVTFPYLPSQRPTRFLAGGIGVTALVAMADIAARHRPEGGYRLSYLARSRARMAFLADLAARHGDLLDLHITDEGTALDVAKYVHDCPPDTVLYLCGPLPLIDAVRAAWLTDGRNPQDCRFETFGTTGRFPATRFVAHVPALGLSVTVEPGRSLLEALEDAGAEVLADCRKGECGICRIPVLGVQNGTIDHRDVFLSPQQQATDAWICPCVSRVHADTNGNGVVHVDLP